MTSQDQLPVLLHLDLASEPISGRIETADQSSEFVGWLGLAAALERALRQDGVPKRGNRSDTGASRRQ